MRLKETRWIIHNPVFDKHATAGGQSREHKEQAVKKNKKCIT